jgi:hypothetical protein
MVKGKIKKRERQKIQTLYGRCLKKKCGFLSQSGFTKLILK